MRWTPVIVLAALLFSVGAGADTYVKNESHVDSYYRGGTVTPAEDSVRELWIGDQRLAYITDGYKIVMDQGQNTLIFVNHHDSTFVETALPLDLSNLFSEEEASTLELFKRQGTVTKSESEKNVGEWTCTGYDLNDWMVYDDSKLNERDVKIWVTTEVPFDIDAFKEMFTTLEKLSNLSDEYIEARLEIDGFQVATEETMYTEGIAITTTISVTDIAEKEPPAEVYSVPDGWTKKDLLTLDDLRS